MCNNLVIVKPYLVLIPNPRPDVFKTCPLASLLRWRTITQGFQLPCFGTSSWLLENGERDLRAVMLPKAATVAKGGFTRGLKWRLQTHPSVGLGSCAWPRVSRSFSQSIPRRHSRTWHPSSQGSATPGHSHTDQVVGDSCLQPSPSNLEELDLMMGQKMRM